jgi:hypothetical protein
VPFVVPWLCGYAFSPAKTALTPSPHDFAVRVQVARPRAETFSDFRKDILWEALDNGRIVELAHEIGFATLAILQVERSCEL